MAVYHRVSANLLPADAVTVRVRRAGTGTAARVSWVPRDAAHVPNNQELPVEEALARAEAVRAEQGFERVAVAIDEPELWQAGWGRLADDSASREPYGLLDGVRPTGDRPLSEDEIFDLAIDQERERDA